MKIEIVSREIIKPCSRTPKSYNLCFMDQDAPPIYSKVCLFYQNTCTDNLKEVIAKRSQSLKSSLSKVLTRFYLLAGRIRDKMTVSLEDDDGTEFIEAQVDSNLSEYLEKPIQEMCLHLVPEDFWALDARPLLIVQASFFKCGGMAIGMNFSHKVSDAASFTSFINAWADTAMIGKADNIDNPDFSGSIVFPAIKDHFKMVEHIPETIETNNKRKRFLFTAQKIAQLQEKATNQTTIRKATRVEAVTGFLWRIRIKMSMKKAGGSSVPSVLLMPVNVRKWLQLPIHGATYGNLLDGLIVPTDSCRIELPYLTGLIREQINESCKAYSENVDGKLLIERILGNHDKIREVIYQPDVNNFLVVSSWSKLRFYEANFGWGKPTWIATHNQTPYFVFLMDTRDGTGIEAWVSFSEEEMDIFERDEELMTYAIPDPSVL